VSGSWRSWIGEDLILRLRVTPRSAVSQLVTIEGDVLRVRLQAPPVEGAANRELLRFLADAFGVPKSAIVLEKGATARVKQVRIHAPRRFPAGDFEWQCD